MAARERHRGGSDDSGGAGEVEVEACPVCERSAIRLRSKSMRTWNQLPNDAPRYRCRECDHEFDEPLRRENRGTTSAGQTHAGGRALLNADPEEWP